MKTINKLAKRVSLLLNGRPAPEAFAALALVMEFALKNLPEESRERAWAAFRDMMEVKMGAWKITIRN